MSPEGREIETWLGHLTTVKLSMSTDQTMGTFPIREKIRQR